MKHPKFLSNCAVNGHNKTFNLFMLVINVLNHRWDLNKKKLFSDEFFVFKKAY